MHTSSASSGPSDPFARERLRMVEKQIHQRGITDERVLEAMRTVPRHLFVQPAQQSLAYTDGPLPIGDDQTISQPFVVAAMTAALHPQPGRRFLEVGTGSGYQAAVLAATGATVFSIERIPALARKAAERLAEAGYSVHLRTGNGYEGWPDEAPFDGILLTAAAPELPPALTGQLKPSGTLVAPLGTTSQTLYAWHFDQNNHWVSDPLFAVRFVPLIDQS